MCQQLLCMYTVLAWYCAYLPFPVESSGVKSVKSASKRLSVLARHASHTTIETLPCSCVGTDASRKVERVVPTTHAVLRLLIGNFLVCEIFVVFCVNVVGFKGLRISRECS